MSTSKAHRTRCLAVAASATLAACCSVSAHAQGAALAGNLQICRANSPSSAFDVSRSAADANGDYWVTYRCNVNCADWRDCQLPANSGGGGAKRALAFVVDGMGGHLSFTTAQAGTKTVLLHTGTGGTRFMHSLSRQIEAATAAKVVMVRWERGFSNWGWFTRSSAPATRVPHLTRRVASVIAWVHEHLAGPASFGTVGCSMGTQATLGAVYWHGVDPLVDYQLMVGGPGLWDINAGCGRRRHATGYCDLDARRACGTDADCVELSPRSRCAKPGPIPAARLYESVINHVHATQACDVSAAGSAAPAHAPFDESGFRATAGDWDFDHPIDFQMDLWGRDGDRRWAMGDAMRVFNSITSAAGHPKRWNTTRNSNHCAAIGDGVALRLLMAGMNLRQPAPPTAAAMPPKVSLVADGDGVRLPLARLFAAADEPLAFRAISEDPTLVAVRIEGGQTLVLDANAHGREGTAVITVTARDWAGQSATASFRAVVELAPVGFLRRWWRLGLPGVQPR